MNVLQINKTGRNLITSVISDMTGISHEVQNDLSDTVVNKDVIIVGIGDNPEDYNIDKLIEARNNGVTIIFAHSSPTLYIEQEIEETEENYSKRQDEYLKKLKDNFGIEKIISDYEYIFYKNVAVKDSTFISELPKEFDIQLTHTLGIELSSKYNIIIDNPNEVSSQSNYYLAELMELNKGKVVMWNIGHCEYNRTDIKKMTKEENQILIKLVK